MAHIHHRDRTIRTSRREETLVWNQEMSISDLQTYCTPMTTRGYIVVTGCRTRTTPGGHWTCGGSRWATTTAQCTSTSCRLRFRRQCSERSKRMFGCSTATTTACSGCSSRRIGKQRVDESGDQFLPKDHNHAPRPCNQFVFVLQRAVARPGGLD